MVGPKTLRGIPSLKHLLLDYNELSCVDEAAFRELKELEILTLNNNKLATLGKDVYNGLSHLRTLKMSDNNWVCDCNLSWLSRMLKTSFNRGLGQNSAAPRCHQPSQLKGLSLLDAQDHEFKCSAEKGSSQGQECGSEPQCPHPCKCSADGIVDCRENSLTRVPTYLPEDTVELLV